MTKIEDNIIKNIDNIPVLPITVNKVLDITKDINTSPNDLSKVISIDPTITMRLLKLVNSAYYGLSTRVTSVVKAIIYLGVNTIRNLVLASSLMPLVGRYAKKSWLVLDVYGYWKHSLATGVVAKFIAKKINIDKIFWDEFFISGLLHDIGKVIIDHNFSEQYIKVIEAYKDSDKTIIEIEDNILGINHAEVGRLLAERWALTNTLKEVMAYHHNPKECSEENKYLVYSVNVANTFCNRNKLFGTVENTHEVIQPEIMEFLNLKHDDLESWKSDISVVIDEASVFLNIL